MLEGKGESRYHELIKICNDGEFDQDIYFNQNSKNKTLGRQKLYLEFVQENRKRFSQGLQSRLYSNEITETTLAR